MSDGDDWQETAELCQLRLKIPRRNIESPYYIFALHSFDGHDGSYFAGGVGKIFAIFLFKIIPSFRSRDKSGE
jgi:hypothetical protein